MIKIRMKEKMIMTFWVNFDSSSDKNFGKYHSKTTDVKIN